jgi:hypothetical protein
MYMMRSGYTPAPPVVILPNVTGNWELSVQLPQTTPPAFPTNPVEVIFGSLASSGSTVTGTLHAEPLSLPNCVAASTDIAVTGTIDASNNLNLTAPLSGGTATIAVSLTPVTTTTPSGVTITQPLLAGTYQVVGGACAQPSIALNAFQVPNVTGTYSGTLMQLFVNSTDTAPTVSVTATLAESTTPNSDGEYALSGTVTATGACNTTITFTQGMVVGESLQSYPGFRTTILTPLPPSFQGSALPPSSTPTILGTLINLPDCSNFSYSGLLKKN